MFFLVTDILFPKRSRDFHWAQNVNSRKIIKRNAWLFYPLTTAYFPRAAKGKGEPGILPYVHKLDTVRRWIDVDLFRNFRSIDEVYRSIWGLGCNEYLKKFEESTGLDLREALVPVIEEMQKSPRTRFIF